MSSHRAQQRGAPPPVGELVRERLDKWLWAARFYKTRSLASAAIEAGRVRLAGARVKPSKEIRAGDTVIVDREGLCWEVEVSRLSLRRGPVAEAAGLYAEDEKSRLAREALLEERARMVNANPLPKGRPTKRNRRTLQRLSRQEPQ